MTGTGQKLSNEKIEEALNLLAEAAKEKKQELLNLVGDKYSELKDTFSDTAHRASDSVRQYSQMEQERVRDAAARIDENVHASPWSYIGGVALGALILGYLMGRKSD